MTPTLTTSIIKRNAALMNFNTRRLPCNENSCVLMNLKYRIRPKWQMSLTQATLPDFLHKRFE